MGPPPEPSDDDELVESASGEAPFEPSSDDVVASQDTASYVHSLQRVVCSVASGFCCAAGRSFFVFFCDIYVGFVVARARAKKHAPQLTLFVTNSMLIYGAPADSSTRFFTAIGFVFFSVSLENALMAVLFLFGFCGP